MPATALPLCARPFNRVRCSTRRGRGEPLNARPNRILKTGSKSRRTRACTLQSIAYCISPRRPDAPKAFGFERNQAPLSRSIDERRERAGQPFNFQRWIFRHHPVRCALLLIQHHEFEGVAQPARREQRFRLRRRRRRSPSSRWRTREFFHFRRSRGFVRTQWLTYRVQSIERERISRPLRSARGL